MLVSADWISSGETLEADVCVIGGGVAGLTLAAALARAGRSVTVLESGGLDEDPSKEDLSRGENVGEPYDQLTEGRYRRLGGCSHLWNIDLGEGELGPRLQALREIDFEERPWVAESGWPFGRKELDRYYGEAYRLLGLCARDDEQTEPARDEFDGRSGAEPEAFSQLPLDPATVETTLFRFMPRQILCERLPRELSEAPGVRILTNASVTELERRPGSSEIECVRVAVDRSHEFTLWARTFVLAAGAVENARLLLASGARNGIGNENDLVGRYFMEHPHFCAGWLIPSSRRTLQRLGYYRIHRDGSGPVMAKLRLSDAVLRRERLLDYCVGLRPVWRTVPTEGVRSLLELRDSFGRGNAARGLASNLAAVFGDMPGVARFAKERLTERIGGRQRPNVVKLNAMTEQSPNPASRVSLSEERDSLGRQRVRLDWRLSEGDSRSIEQATEILGKEMRRSGIGTVVPNSGFREEIKGGWHHMGTTRMHRDPRHGVVDENCRVHGSGNLFVAGPSVFPASGYANPILTIVALSLRLAGHLSSLPTAVPLPPARA